MKENNTASNNYESILKLAASKNKVNSVGNTYPAYIVLIVFVILSFLIRGFFKDKVRTDNQIAFDKAVNSVTLRIDNKYRSNLQVLTSIQGLYDAYIDVVRDYFKLYSSVPTSTNHSISSLMFVPNVSNVELEDHVFNMQRQGLWDYNLHPTQSRDNYYPIEFIEPIDKNINNAGFDFKSDDNTNSAIDKARDNNMITATCALNSLNNQNKGGFYLIAPVYNQGTKRSNEAECRKNYKGAVIEEINIEHFFKDALGGNFPSDTSVIFEFVDINGGKENVIFKSKNYIDNIIKNESYNGLQESQIIKIADREIEARFATIPNFNGWFTENLHNITFVIALLLSLAFFGFVYSVTTGKARAENLAEKMTRSQRRIVDSSKDIISVIDMAGNWKSLNPATNSIFGYSPEVLIGKSIYELFKNDTDKQTFDNSIANVEDEKTVRADYQMKTNSGELKWLSWSLTISKTDGLIYAVGRDVTLEKLAEQQAVLRAKQMKLAEQFTREASEFKSYFMTKLSHQMRNSLTGIIGYLQLLSMKVYDSEEEQDAYIALAEESSEELFAFVSDMVDVAASANSNSTEIETIKVDNIIQEVNNKFAEGHKNIKFSVDLMDEGGEPAKIIADQHIVQRALSKIFEAVSVGTNDVEIQVAATENPYEGATEIQMMTNPNVLVMEMIDIYKANSNNIIEVLDKDVNDILLNFALASSIIRMMNGTMSVETLGAEDGNIVQITLPINKKTV